MASSNTPKNQWTLKIIAVLLAMNLGFAVFNSNEYRPAQAFAQSTSQPQGIPNAGLQRKQMLEKLERLIEANEQLASLLTSGRVEVTVNNLEDISSGD